MFSLIFLWRNSRNVYSCVSAGSIHSWFASGDETVPSEWFQISDSLDAGFAD
uniref:Uncharacterized protein n=1 Tax=Anopheles atroparvus TaxID=41427 RepID=A0AAG5CYU3_ANOAO